MMRADVYLFSFGFVKSRQKAKSLIESGNVTINGITVKKPSFEIDESIENAVNIIDDCPYVSRGGLKLEKMLEHLKTDLNGKVALDIGASTGGFTHCLILNGVKRVYAIDSGTDQLDALLKNDDRVVSIENFNAKNLTIDMTGQEVDIITVDVSFISQTLILPVAAPLLKNNGLYIGLIKPQFEVGRDKIGKGGIVKDIKHRKEAVQRVLKSAKECGIMPVAFIESPITGGDGNIEYVVAFSKGKQLINDDLILNTIIKKRGQYEI